VVRNDDGPELRKQFGAFCYTKDMQKETIVFGGGCFWCTEVVFKKLKGVVSVTPGYTGGEGEATYEAVSSGKTGHAEAVQIEYNSEDISLKDLLTVFFATHDPTTPNRQGADVGTQYRSVIFYTHESQKAVVEDFIKKLNMSSYEGENITTEILPLKDFFEAEKYHKDYYERNKNLNPYCEVVINPKLQKVQKEFQELLKQN